MSAEFLERLEAMLAAGEREQLLETFFREVLGLADEELETMPAEPSWAGRVESAHTFSRELATPPDQWFDARQAATVSLPVLLLHGSESPEALKRDMQKVEAALPDVRVAILDGQAHSADLLAPELVAERLLAFLGQPHQPNDERIHRAVSADGTEIVGRVHGQGPLLVFLHGRLDDGDGSWGPLLRS